MTKPKLVLIMTNKKRSVIHALYKKNKKINRIKVKKIWVKTIAFQRVISHKIICDKKLKLGKSCGGP